MRALPVVTALLLSTAAIGDDHLDHAHPIEDLPLHEQFYSTWFMPDNPARSCCNKADCYPTIIRYDGGGRLHAQRREDGFWLLIPSQKIEQHRDNPDGRNHMCAPPPGTPAGDVVFCFTLGSGI